MIVLNVVIFLTIPIFLILICIGCYKSINQDLYIVYKEQDGADPSNEEKERIVVKKEKLFKLS